MPRRSIRVRMTFAFACAISLLMLLACGGLIWYAERAAEHRADALLAATLAKVRTDLTDNAPGFDAADLREDARLSGAAIWVVGPDGQFLFQSQAGRLPRLSGADWRVFVRAAGSRTVVLGLPWRETRLALRYQAALLVLLGLFVTAAATVGAWVVVGRTLSPIGLLARQAAAAPAEGPLLCLTAPSGDAEIVGLVATLNELLTRIAQTAAAKGRFHAAASHELRTPLQVLSGRLELALQRPRSEDEYRQYIGEAHTHTQRLVALTCDLLLLHQLDGLRRPEGADVDLTDVCVRAVAWAADRAGVRGVFVSAELSAAAVLTAPLSHVEMLVRNLLENAVEYAPAGGSVRVAVHVENKVPFLVIANDFSPDDFSPASPADPHAWLEPFFRQGRTVSPRGTGLGLTICKAIVNADGWTLDLCAEAGTVAAQVTFGRSEKRGVGVDF